MPNHLLVISFKLQTKENFRTGRIFFIYIMRKWKVKFSRLFWDVVPCC